MATIDIPKDLLPADGRFGCGPSKVRPASLAAVLGVGSDLVGTSHRQAPVRDVVRELARDGAVVVTQRSATLDPDAEWRGPTPLRPGPRAPLRSTAAPAQTNPASNRDSNAPLAASPLRALGSVAF